MHFTLNLITLLCLMLLPLKEIRCNKHVSIEQNNSDQLNNHINQHSSLHNEAYHSSASAIGLASKRSATDPPASYMEKTTTSSASHTEDLEAANEWYEQNRFRRNSDGRIESDASTITKSEANGAIEPPMNFLRLFFCGTGYQNCIFDERLNSMQHDFLKQIPRMAEITLPTNFIDWDTKQLNTPSDVHSTNHGNSGGRREWPPLLVDEPHYVIILNDEAKPRQLALISAPESLDDPFIPQRGRRQSNSQTYDDPFIPMRGRRSKAQPWDDPFIPMRGRRAEKAAWDDPFYPMRGRRAEKSAWDDPFFPMRGRRADQNGWDDPFFPMRGRRDDRFDDPFIPMRGRRSISKSSDMKMRQRRELFDQPFSAIYTPTEEVIVKLNGVYDTIHSNQLKHASNLNEWLNEAPTKSQPMRLIESMNLPLLSRGYLPGNKRSASKKKLQQQQSNQFFIPNNFVSTPDDDGDNSLMNDYSFNNYPESPQMSRAHIMHKNRIQRPIHLLMKSSTDLSQNRDAANSARGRDTSFLF